MKKKGKIAIIIIILVLVSSVFLLRTGYIDRLIATSDDGVVSVDSVVSDSGAVSDDDCDYTVLVDLDFVYIEPNTGELSDYEFSNPTLKGDMLFIKEFRIKNVGNCNISFPFKVLPKLYFDSKEVYTFCNNAPILIHNLSLDKDYYSETIGLPHKWNKYSGSPYSFRYCGPHPLDKEGEYTISTTVEDYSLDYSLGYSIGIKNINYLSVKNHAPGTNASFWVKNLEDLKVQKRADYGFWLAVFLAFLNVCLFSFQIWSTKKQEKNMDKRFDELSDSQNQIINKNNEIVNQLTELNKHNPEEIQNKILQENKTTNIELANLNKNLSKKTKSAKKK